MKRSNVSSAEILEQAGIKSAKTLTRWHQAGLIPAPEIGTHPNGRGKMAYWPEWVLSRCQEIRRLTDEGISLAEIAKKLSRGRRYRYRDAVRRLDLDEGVLDAWGLVQERIRNFVKEAGLKGTGGDAISDQIASSRVLIQAIDLMERGYKPVAVCLGKSIVVVPDAALGNLLAQSNNQGTLLAVSLFDDLKEAYSGSSIELPDRPRYEPVAMVEAVGENDRHELRVVVGVDGHVRIEGFGGQDIP